MITPSIGASQVLDELLLCHWQVVLGCIGVVLVCVEHDDGIGEGVRSILVSKTLSCHFGGSVPVFAEDLHDHRDHRSLTGQAEGRKKSPKGLIDS